jgi:hypothetical protein
MSPRFRQLRALPLLCCLLTAGASGDDFCLPRLIFGVVRAGSAALPLDDPNTDFVETSDAPAAGSAWRCAFDNVSLPFFGVPTLPILLTYGPPDPARHLAGTSPCPIPQSTIPLRC